MKKSAKRSKAERNPEKIYVSRSSYGGIQIHSSPMAAFKDGHNIVTEYQRTRRVTLVVKVKEDDKG